jgi:hypothetical protein
VCGKTVTKKFKIVLIAGIQNKIKRMTERQKDRKTERQKDRKTERQKDRMSERQKDIKTE